MLVMAKIHIKTNSMGLLCVALGMAIFFYFCVQTAPISLSSWSTNSI